jgi:hypothetical protein
MKSDKREIAEILDQIKIRGPEWHEEMVDLNIDIAEMSYEESVFTVSYLKRLENLEKIMCANDPDTLLIYNKKGINVTSRVGKYSKNPKYSNMWCHYGDNNNQNTADCREISKFKQ